MNNTPITIIHIEDSQEIRQIVQQYLEIQGIHVLSASFGYEGLQLIWSARPHLILLDQMLPDMSGLEIARRLRDHELTRYTPIIMLSVDDSTVVREEALHIGINAFIPKPIDFPLLEREITVLAGEFVRSEPGRAAPPPPPSHPDLGILFGRQPQEVFPLLAEIPRRKWAETLGNKLVEGDPTERGLAVIALAAWQKQPDAPFNSLKGQQHFWNYVRHQLASIRAAEAGESSNQLAPIARALIYPPDKIPGALERCMSSKRSEVRRWALRILMENDDPAVVPLAVDALRDPKDGVRAAAALVLAKSGDTTHVPVLTRLLNDESGGVREQAGAALVRIGGDMAVLALLAALSEGSAEAAEVAANALAQIASDEAVNALVQAAEERCEPAVLRQVAHALGKLKKNSRCRVALLKLTRHTDETIQRTAQSYILLR